MTLFILPIAGGNPAYYFNSDNVHDYDTNKVTFYVRDRKLFTVDGHEVVYWIRDMKVYEDEACTDPPKFHLSD